MKFIKMKFIDSAENGFSVFLTGIDNCLEPVAGFLLPLSSDIESLLRNWQVVNYSIYEQKERVKIAMNLSWRWFLCRRRNWNN